MKLDRSALTRLKRDHPIFFWGTTAVLTLLIVATVVVAVRVPIYMSQARAIDARMSETERAMRDRILQSQARRSELAVALLQRELRLRSMEQDQIHLALSVEDSTLSLRHGAATLREVPVAIGPDSVITAPDGRTWRLIRALGERHVVDKQISPAYTIPEWVYIGSGRPVPPEAAREVEGALGRYVLKLDDGTLIYSEPETGPFTDVVIPGSFQVPEREMRVMFDAVRTDMPIYIY